MATLEGAENIVWVRVGMRFAGLRDLSQVRRAESVVLKRGLPVVNDCIQGLKIALSDLFGSCSKERHRT